MSSHDIDPEGEFDLIADKLIAEASTMSEDERANRTTSLKDEGNTYFKDQSFRQAIFKYSCALVYSKENSVILSNRAACHLKLEEYGSALHDAEEAIKYDPTFIKAQYRKGAALMAMGKYKLAYDCFRQVLKLKPSDADAKKKADLSKKAHMEQQFALAIASEMTGAPSDRVKLDEFVSPASYSGPLIDFPSTSHTKYSLEFAKWVMEAFKNEKTKSLPLCYVQTILLDMIKLLKTYPSLVDISIPEGTHLTVCGDTHGQYYDVLNIFELNGLPSETNPYIFNGDYVDRGSYSFELVIVLFILKLVYPNSVHLTRGNHESTSMNMMYGFKGEVLAKADDFTFDLFTECFNCLPLSYCMGKQVLVLHGGLFNDPTTTLDDLRKVNRFRQPPEKGVMCDALWSDPGLKRGRQPPHRGCGVVFGPDVTTDFLDRNGLKLLVRSHEMKQSGHSIDHEGKCVTIFSAPNYCDQMKNKGAWLKFDHDYDYTVHQFDAVPHPEAGSAMKYANPAMRM